MIRVASTEQSYDRAIDLRTNADVELRGNARVGHAESRQNFDVVELRATRLELGLWCRLGRAHETKRRSWTHAKGHDIRMVPCCDENQAALKKSLKAHTNANFARRS